MECPKSGSPLAQAWQHISFCLFSSAILLQHYKLGKIAGKRKPSTRPATANQPVNACSLLLLQPEGSMAVLHSWGPIKHCWSQVLGGEHFTNSSPDKFNCSQTLKMGTIIFYNGYYVFRVTVNLNKVLQIKINGFPVTGVKKKNKCFNEMFFLKAV